MPTSKMLSLLICLMLSLFIFQVRPSAVSANFTVQEVAKSEKADENVTDLTPTPEPLNNHELYNRIVADNKLPDQARQADIADLGNPQESPGHGVKSIPVGVGQGINLYEGGQPCLDFNRAELWKSKSKSPATVWSDSYAGWGAFADDEGVYHRAENVKFSLEQLVGPGNKFDSDQFSAKISSSQPYAAGFGSPTFSVAPGSQVTVAIKYLIFDHDVLGQDYDWVSLGIKPDATLKPAEYVNGYARGHWAELRHTITAGSTGQIMVLIQAHAPVALNSNIYIDDVSITINGVPVFDCTFEADLSQNGVPPAAPKTIVVTSPGSAPVESDSLALQASPPEVALDSNARLTEPNAPTPQITQPSQAAEPTVAVDTQLVATQSNPTSNQFLALADFVYHTTANQPYHGGVNLTVITSHALDGAGQSVIGTLRSYCLTTAATDTFECHWFSNTITLGESRLTFSGSILPDGQYMLPIVSGVGVYANVEGFVQVSTMADGRKRLEIVG